MVARVLTVHFIYRTLRLHGYEDVTLHTINIQELTILQNFPYIYPHVQSQSSRAPSWPSPPARYGLVLPANHYVVASPA